jgi:hypothetical protein
MPLNRDFDLACRLAEEIDRSSGNRRGVPVRWAFARDLDGNLGNAPMGRLVGLGGRGGEVPLKLYLALIWRSSKEPFATLHPARKWAELLALPNPSKNGARRIKDALKTLAEHNLITLEQRRGESSIVTLLRDDGSSRPYTVPRGEKLEGEERKDVYFLIPAEIWTTGKLQRLSAAAVAMLIAVLSWKKRGQDVWWSTEMFPAQYGLSPATRARGTAELVEAGLLEVDRKLIPPKASKAFTVDRVRNIYRVINEALPKKSEDGQAAGATATKKVETKRGGRVQRAGMSDGQLDGVIEQ